MGEFRVISKLDKDVAEKSSFSPTAALSCAKLLLKLYDRYPTSPMLYHRTYHDMSRICEFGLDNQTQAIHYEEESLCYKKFFTGM